MDIRVKNLGVGALEIRADGRRVFVDAFNSINGIMAVQDGDILLITHDDGDHFFPESFLELSGKDITIIGPPSIAMPLLERGKVDSRQITVLISKDNHNPETVTSGNIHITCYRTEHFNKWNPVHNSYLLEIGGKRIYITGDSLLTMEMSDIIIGIDIVICNLVDEGYLKRSEDSRFAIHHLLSYLLRITTAYTPEKIIGTHLIDFDGTVEAEAMAELVRRYGFNHIVIPKNKDEIISL